MPSAKLVLPLIFGIGALAIIARQSTPHRTDTLAAEELFYDSDALRMAKAAEVGDISTLETLLNKGVDVNTVARGNATILSRAFFAKNKDAYLYLLNHNADPNVTNSWGNCVTNLAAREEDPFWLKEVLDHGGNVNVVSDGNSLGTRTPIFYALSQSRIENVRLLIEHSANLNFQDEVGDFPMYYAAQKQDYDIVLLLLRAGADYRLANKWGHTLYELTMAHDGMIMKPNQTESFAEVKRFLLGNVKLNYP